MKRIKNAKPSTIFQLVVVVLLFSYRGCSPTNEHSEDMPIGEAVVSKAVLQLPTLVNFSPAIGFTVSPVFGAGQFTALVVDDRNFFKQFVVLKHAGPSSLEITDALTTNTLQYNRK